MNWGRRVVLPLPVDPRTTTTELFSMRETSWGETGTQWTVRISVIGPRNDAFKEVNLREKKMQQFQAQQRNDTLIYTSCLFLVMGRVGYLLLGRGAGGGPTVEQQLALKCANRKDEGRVDLNLPLPGSAFRPVTSDFTSFFLVAADAFDGLQTT